MGNDLFKLARSTSFAVSCALLLVLLNGVCADAESTAPAYSHAQRHLIPEIVNLTENGVIPPEVLQKNDIRSIGESIIEHLRQVTGETAMDNAPGAYDYLKDTQIQIFFPSEHIDKVLTSGFLNNHVVRRSQGAFSETGKSVEEERLSHLQLEAQREWGPQNPMNYVRPIYSNLDLTLHAPVGTPTATPLQAEGLGYRNGATMYGDIIAVARPEVKYRSTWTPGDSSMGAPARSLLIRSSTFIGNNPANGYFEAQIWGGMDLRDIAEFLIPSSLPADKLQLLKAAGLPIYTYKDDRSLNRFRRIRDQLVYAGDPGKMKAYEDSLQKIRSQFKTSRASFRSLRGGVLSKKEMYAGFPTVSEFPDSRLKPGFSFVTAKENLFTVQSSPSGNDRTYRLTRTDGTAYRLTLLPNDPHSVNDRSVNLEKIHSSKVPYADPFEMGSSYKIEPEDGDPHIRLGRLPPDERLKKLFSDLINRGIYIENATPDSIVDRNFVWTFAGDIRVRDGLTPTEARKLYLEDFPKSWTGLFSPMLFGATFLNEFPPIEALKVSDLVPNLKFKGLSGKFYTVKGHGVRLGDSLSFEISDENRTGYALMTPVSETQEDLARFQAWRVQNRIASNTLAEAGVSAVQEVEGGSNYSIDSEPDAYMAAKWKNFVSKPNDPQTTQLKALFRNLADHGIYVEDLDPTSLRWSQDHWALSRPVSLKTGLTPVEATALYNEELMKSWSFANPDQLRKIVLDQTLVDPALCVANRLSGLLKQPK